jgi:hypothetical protein
MQIVTPRASTAFLYLLKAQPAMEKGKPDQFSVTLLWDEGEPKLAKLQKAIEDVAVAKWGETAKKKLANGQLKNPLRPGSDKEGTNAEDDFAGKVFMTVRSQDKPQVVDADLEPVMDSMDVYSGCIGRADIWLYAFDTAGNKGVSAIINSFQKLDDGERKSGRRPASAAFGDLDDDDAELLG